MKAGYVAMSRNWQDHDIFEGDEFSRLDAWAWLIAHAAWKAGKARIKGTSVILARGELTFSVRFLAEKWGWSKSRVDRFLQLLRDEGMIEARSKIGTTAGHPAGQGQSIIKICNYDKFQQAKEWQRDNDSAASGTTAGQQRDKEEEGKNIYPEANASGADSDKAFWDSAKAYLGKSKASLIGKWVSEHGREETAKAIAAAQVDRAIEPVEYIQGYFRRRKTASQPLIPI